MPTYAKTFLVPRGIQEADMCISFVPMVLEHNYVISVVHVQVVPVVFIISFSLISFLSFWLSLAAY